MKKKLFVKNFVLIIVFLFVVSAFTSSLGFSSYLDDTAPPVTTISFDPPEPNGLNGWYVSSVTVTLNATDDDSGVNITYYIIDHGAYQIYLEPFVLSVDGVHLVEYFSIDKAGNQEEKKSAEINIDKTKPVIVLTYEVEDPRIIIFTALATDATSGMERVEFYNYDVLQETIVGPGPIYVWKYSSSFQLYFFNVKGLILNPEITDEYVNFFAIFVIVLKLYTYIQMNPCAYAYDNAGNWDYDFIENPSLVETISPGIYLFKNLTLPNNYYGFIGKFFIRAKFYL